MAFATDMLQQVGGPIALGVYILAAVRRLDREPCFTVGVLTIDDDR